MLPGSLGIVTGKLDWVDIYYTYSMSKIILVMVSFIYIGNGVTCVWVVISGVYWVRAVRKFLPRNFNINNELLSCPVFSVFQMMFTFCPRSTS